MDSDGCVLFFCFTTFTCWLAAAAASESHGYEDDGISCYSHGPDRYDVMEMTGDVVLKKK